MKQPSHNKQTGQPWRKLLPLAGLALLLLIAGEWPVLSESYPRDLPVWLWFMLRLSGLALGLLWVWVYLGRTHQQTSELVQARDDEFKRDNEALLTTLNQHAIVSVADRAGRITAVNDAFCTISGYSREELIGANHRIVNSGEQSAEFWVDMWADISSGRPWRHEVCNRAKNGSLYWVDTVVAPLLGADGEVEKYISIRTDISRSKTDALKLSAALRDSQALLSTLHLHAIVSVADRAGRITEVNDAFCAISGYSREELIGANHRIVNSGEQSAEFWVDMWADISSGRPWRHEVCNRAKNGSLYWVDTVVAPLQGADGRVEKYISIRTDISAHKFAQQALTLAKQLADAANQAKSDFLANMSHELRTPMNAILGLLTLLGKTQLSSRQLDYTEKTQGAARSLLGLLNEILDFSKIEAGKMTLDPQQFLFEDVLTDLSVILSSNLGAKKKVEILFDIDPELPPSLIGDALRLKQVLINLSGNALKFTAEGSLVLAVKLMERNASVATLKISVRDTGIGIAPENHQRIFSGFSQAESSTTRRYGGTGLGVAISQRLVALMGGKLELESALGQGSCFYFTISLPLAMDEELPPGLSHAPVDAAANSASTAAAPRVLVVEDDPQARDLLARMCASLGWAAEVLGSGEAALQRLALLGKRTTQTPRGVEACPYEAIFVDWQLPGLDGWQTCQGVRALGARPIPLLLALVTAQDRELLAQRSPQEQALLDGYLVKPVTSAMLSNALSQARALRSRSGTAGLAVMESTAATPNEAAVLERRLAGLRLLLVEDNLNNQLVARELLEDEGATVQIANDGQEGVAAVAAMAPPFDVVLMDLQMPVMDGLTAARTIRQDLRLLNLPIVAMTANAMSSDREACLAVGMNDHIGKPFELDDLVRVVLRLAGRQAQAGPRPSEPQLDSALSAQATAAGVELAEALQRLGGKQEIYGRMLRSFVSDLARMPEQLRSALTQGDRLGAIRQMHTLKGLAATLGAVPLSAAAARAEKQLLALAADDQDQNRDKARQQALDLARPVCKAIEAALPGLTGLQATLQASSQAIAAIQTAQARAQAFDVTLLRTELQRLALLLQDADMAAMDHMAQVFKSYCVQSGAAKEQEEISAKMRALDDAVGMLDFELAMRLCAELIEGLST
ncbi:PAS domain-containing hybrid sensor histidine kinase/response regulator [Roseateles oligotrophus]|uniref:histidine kinase n=1 Tax=Roseateles oligotrophus TaxID=1769250 RepID=A0ABT2YFW3_9BURK|nr:PAS domain-containing hybrid sensor histidine kinase/response regulator [Roseateles oligotrophus]MCV2368940.1 PAS domain S-box protein [Roseateles oligotrophus]